MTSIFAAVSAIVAFAVLSIDLATFVFEDWANCNQKLRESNLYGVRCASHFMRAMTLAER